MVSIPQKPDAKRQFLIDIDHANLVATADNLIGELGEVRGEIQELKEKVRNAQEFLDDRETGFTLSEGYLAGKNAEIRKAWLLKTLGEDSFYTVGLEEQRGLKTNLDRAEGRYETLGRQWELAKLEIRLAIAQLHFLAGD